MPQVRLSVNKLYDTVLKTAQGLLNIPDNFESPQQYKLLFILSRSKAVLDQHYKHYAIDYLREERLLLDYIDCLSMPKSEFELKEILDTIVRLSLYVPEQSSRLGYQEYFKGTTKGILVEYIDYLFEMYHQKKTNSLRDSLGKTIENLCKLELFLPQLTKQEWKDIGELLKFSSPLTALTEVKLVRCIDHESCDIFSDFLQALSESAKGLKTLDLSSNLLEKICNAQTSNDLFDYLRLESFQSLKSLNLSDNQLGYGGFFNLLVGVYKYTKIVNLNLSNNRIWFSSKENLGNQFWKEFKNMRMCKESLIVDLCWNYLPELIVQEFGKHPDFEGIQLSFRFVQVSHQTYGISTLLNRSHFIQPNEVFVAIARDLNFYSTSNFMRNLPSGTLGSGEHAEVHIEYLDRFWQCHLEIWHYKEVGKKLDLQIEENDPNVYLKSKDQKRYLPHFFKLRSTNVLSPNSRKSHHFYGGSLDIKKNDSHQQLYQAFQSRHGDKFSIFSANCFTTTKVVVEELIQNRSLEEQSSSMKKSENIFSDNRLFGAFKFLTSSVVTNHPHKDYARRLILDLK